MVRLTLHFRRLSTFQVDKKCGLSRRNNDKTRVLKLLKRGVKREFALTTAGNPGKAGVPILYLSRKQTDFCQTDDP